MDQTPGSEKNVQAVDERKAGLFTGAMILILTLAGVISALYAAKHWWLPPLASVEGVSTDLAMTIFFILIGIVFVGVHLVMSMFFVKHAAHGNKRAVYWHESKTLELTWTIIPAIILILFTVFSGISWYSLKVNPAVAAEENPVKIGVTAAQFAWYAQYPGPDGKLGETHSKYVAGKNPIGLNPEDPAGKDDLITTNEMAFPVNRPVQIELRARDVIHSFFVPDFRVKQDALPGRITRVDFLAHTVGDYEVACAELCGNGHYIMRSTLKVVSDADYEKWLQAKVEQAGKK